ncbi:MAG: hypothetical protein ABW061_00130 [Polyangiaceae bacterium]
MSSHDKDDIQARLREVDWGQFRTAYGSADRIPEWLWDVRFSPPTVAGEGGHMLWCSLCHQKGQLASAAEPALPFLLEFLPHVGLELQIEILDILHGLAVCSYPGNGYPASGYHARVRERLQAALPQITAFEEHESEDVRYFVRDAIAVLDDRLS